MKKLSTILLSLILVLSLAVPAFAATSYVEYSGHNIFGFGPGSEYTATDLFDNFKNVMPGDVRTETITVSNTADCCDFIKVYMRAVAHNEQTNPLSQKVSEAESVVSMSDFLSQLSMRVWNGDELIYEASPDELDGLKNNVYLGTLRRNQSLELRVELVIPADLGNEYSYRVGEVDWVFVIEEFDDPVPDPVPDPIPEPEPNIPQTRDHSSSLVYVTLMGISLYGCIVLLLIKYRKESREQ